MFVPGQRVVCIDTKVRPQTSDPKGLKLIKEGNVYLIDMVTHFGLGVTIVGINTGNKSYFSDRFRPIVERDTDISVFNKLLVPKKVDEVV